MIRGRKRLRHDFRRSGSCSVPLTLALRNCSDSSISVCVEAGPPSGVQPAGAVWHAEVGMPLLSSWEPIYTLTHVCTLAQACEMVELGGADYQPEGRCKANDSNGSPVECALRSWVSQSMLSPAIRSISYPEGARCMDVDNWCCTVQVKPCGGPRLQPPLRPAPGLRARRAAPRAGLSPQEAGQRWAAQLAQHTRGQAAHALCCLL